MKVWHFIIWLILGAVVGYVIDRVVLQRPALPRPSKEHTSYIRIIYHMPYVSNADVRVEGCLEFSGDDAARIIDRLNADLAGIQPGAQAFRYPSCRFEFYDGDDHLIRRMHFISQKKLQADHDEHYVLRSPQFFQFIADLIKDEEKRFREFNLEKMIRTIGSQQ